VTVPPLRIWVAWYLRYQTYVRHLVLAGYPIRLISLPQQFNKNQPLSTVICPDERTVDFTTRLAKLLVKKTQMPTYVTNSISLADTGLGGTMEEEMEAFKVVVGAALQKLKGMANLSLEQEGNT
jgi:hypothetical protein